METKFINMENNKTSFVLNLFKFVLNLPQKLDLRCSNEHVAFQYLSIYFTLKNIRQEYKNNKLKIKAPTRNDEFELPEVSNSVSNIQDYIENIIKNTRHYSLIFIFNFTSTGLIID